LAFLLALLLLRLRVNARSSLLFLQGGKNVLRLPVPAFQRMRLHPSGDARLLSDQAAWTGLPGSDL
jgi:hypothetical protein